MRKALAVFRNGEVSRLPEPLPPANALDAGEPEDAVRILEKWRRHADEFRPLKMWRNGWTDSEDAPPPNREWLIPGWLPRGRTALLVGDGGLGKSTLALQIAASAAAGRSNWLGGEASAGTAPTATALFLSWEEERDETDRRLRNIQRGLGFSASDLGDRLAFVDLSGERNAALWASSTVAFSARIGEARGALTETGRRVRALAENVGASLIIVDPIAAAYGLD